MPEAIATTKRKFYKVLDTLNNLQAPNPSHTTTTTTPSIKPPSEPVAKRVRRDVSNSSTIGQPLQVTYLARQKNSDPSENIPLNSSRNTPSTPNFSPGSHDAFLARLKTFSSVSQWHPKPEPIGEVAWAKRGWICVGVNTVACRGGCEKRAVVDLTPRVTTNVSDDAAEDELDDESSDTNGVQASLVRYYQDFIVSGHAEGCLWRRSGCQDDIYHLQVVRPAIWQPALSARFASIEKVTKAIHAVVIRETASSVHPTDPTATMSMEQLLACLPESILPALHDVVSSETRHKMLKIALHGWEGAVDSGNELLCCKACFQRIGLWMYQPGYQSRHRQHDDSSDAHDEQDDDEVAIDLMEMHREHCPWRNAETQMASGNLRELNASQILQRVVATFAREQRRRAGDIPSTPLRNGIEDENETVEDNDRGGVAALSKDEVARQDKERESRLQRLKNLLTIKRRRIVETPSGSNQPSSVGSKSSSMASK